MSARPVPAPQRKPIAKPPANWFSIPNAVVDRLLSCSVPAEVYCYLVVLRETAGRNRAEAEIPTAKFQEICKLSERGVLAALHELREVKHVITGRQGKFSMNYEESEWNLKEQERTPRTRVAKKEPAAGPELVTAVCHGCGVPGEHAKGCKASNEVAEDAPECMLSQEDVRAQPAPECMLQTLTTADKHALECMLQPPVSPGFSDLPPQRDLLVKYLTATWAPIYHAVPTEAQLVAIEKRLGDTPVHCFAARCDHRRDSLAKPGKFYGGLMLLLADDARKNFAELRNHNVRSIDKGKAEPMSDRAAGEAFAAKIPNVEEARLWFEREDFDPETRAAIGRKFPELGKGAV